MSSQSKLNVSELSMPEVVAKSRELRKALFDARIQKATARLEKTHTIRALRRDIARCETRVTQLDKQNKI